MGLNHDNSSSARSKKNIVAEISKSKCIVTKKGTIFYINNEIGETLDDFVSDADIVECLISGNNSQIRGHEIRENRVSFGCHNIFNADSTTNLSKIVDLDNIDAIVFDPPYDLKNIYSHIPTPKEGQALILFYDYKYFAEANYHAFKKGWNPKFELIWDCQGSVISDGMPLNSHKSCAVFGDFDFKNKLAIVDSRENGRLKSIEKFNQSTVNKKYGHKHAKPHEWLKAIFLGIEGKRYLDMFAGSGSTLFVGMDIGLKCTMIEIDKNNCDEIKSKFLEKMGQ